MSRAQSTHDSRRVGTIQTTNRITGSTRWWALTAVLISMFFSSLDQTVISTAMPTIIGDLNGLKLYAWVFTAYILASSVTVPIYGRLSDTYGRKPFYVFGLGVFMVGSMLSGLAQSMMMLILSRTLQGLGAGAMMSMPRATIGDIFNPRERGRWMGLIMGVFGVASLIGPAMGGWFTDHLSWRWIFYINLPVALVAMGMVLYALPTVRTETRHHIDWSGSLYLVGTLVPMLLGFTWGGNTYAWTSWQEIGLFGFAAVMLVVFIINELHVKQPVIEPAIFKNITFSSTVLISLLIMMSMFSIMLFLPLFVQGVLGISAQNAGYIITPMMLSFIVASIINGQLMTRTGRYKIQAVIGGALLLVGAYLFTRITVHTAWPTLVRDMVVMGLGIGSLMPVTSTVIQNLFPYRMLGQINATQQTMTSMGGAIASSIFGSVMANRFAAALPKLLPPQLKDMMAKLPASEQNLLKDPQALTSAGTQAAMHKKFMAFGPQGQQIYHEFIVAFHQALTSAIAHLYDVALIFAIGAFLATLALREVPLKQEEFFTEGEPNA